MFEYITKEFLEAALTKELGNIEVIDFKASQANQSGDNYTSEIYRTQVNYQTKNGENKEISLIVKCMIETEAMLDVLKDFEPFKKENEMYNKVLPEFQGILNEKFSPISYQITEKPNKIFVLEDLKSSNYSIPDRIVGLDLDHCKIVLEKLAKFHAVSMKLAEQNPQVFDTFYFGFFHPSTEKTGGSFIDHYVDNLKVIVESLKDSDGFQGIVKKLEILEPIFNKKLFQCVNQTGKILVLNHGDIWSNNIMFKYDDKSNKPTDAVFIDYQDSYYASLGIDLNYFIVTSPTLEVRENNLNDILSFYYQKFSECLELLKYPKIPTLSDVLEEIETFKFYGFANTIGLMPLIRMEKDPTVVSNLENLVGKDKETNDKLRRFQVNGASVQNHLKSLLKTFDDSGII